MPAAAPVIRDNHPGQREAGHKADLHLYGQAVSGYRTDRRDAADDVEPSWPESLQQESAGHQQPANCKQEQQRSTAPPAVEAAQHNGNCQHPYPFRRHTAASAEKQSRDVGRAFRQTALAGLLIY
ncbi:hypothetical protein D3C75_669290 [compost metagenome]